MNLTAIKHDDDATYHYDPRLSASILKLAHTKTMAHVWARYFDPEREPEDPSKALEFGKMFHCAVLQPERFDDWFTVIPEGLDRRTKEGKQLWADIQASGKQPVSATDWKMNQKMASSVHALPVWADIMANNPIFEGCVYTETRRVKFDIFVPPCKRWSNGFLVDLKSAKSADPFWFGRDAHRLGYHVQAGHYADTVAEALGLNGAPEFMLLAVEKSAPYIAAPYLVEPELIFMGVQDAAAAAERIEQCKASGVWPGYHTEPVALEYPAYAFEDDEDDEITTE